jgi:hypothetical protein
MYTFILIVDARFSPERAGDFLKNLGAVRLEPNGRYLVEGNGGMDDGWIAISHRDSIAEDYDERELQLIKKNIQDPKFFLVEGRDTKTAFANNLVLGLGGSMNVFVDNDHGRIASIDSIGHLISTGVDWLHTSS